MSLAASLTSASGAGWLRSARFDLNFIIGTAVLALAIAIGLKHAIIGKRRPGLYNWDESSYCQRWQVDLTVSATPHLPCFQPCRLHSLARALGALHDDE